MAGCPIMICKKCGYAKRSGFDISGSVNSSVIDCSEQCPGCGAILGTPDMFTGPNPGELQVVNRDSNVVTIVVNVVAKYKESGNIELSTYEYSKLPGWAQGLVDLARAHPKLAGAAMALLGVLVVRAADLGQSYLEHGWSAENARLLQDRQHILNVEIIELKEKLDRESDENLVGKNSTMRALEERWIQVFSTHRQAAGELLGLASGDPIAEDDLRGLLADYNDSLRELYGLINSTNQELLQNPNAAKSRVASCIEGKPMARRIVDSAGKPCSVQLSY